MDVYNAFAKLVDPKVPAYLMDTLVDPKVDYKDITKVTTADAKAAYAGLMEFKDVVKAHPITPATLAPSAPNPEIAAAAKKLSAKAYPFLQGVDWNSNLWLENPGSTGPLQVLKAIDRSLVMDA